MFIISHSLQSGKQSISQTYLALSVSFIIFNKVFEYNIYFIISANVFIKYINDTSAWVALRDGSQAKAMNKILPKLQAMHKNIVLLPWSAYYNDKNTSTLATKRKIDECSSSPSIDNVDSSKDECAVGQTPEKVPRLSKGYFQFFSF